MQRRSGVALLCVVVLVMLARAEPLLSQTGESQWASGTILSVNPHHGQKSDSSVDQYDVTVQVKNMLYTVLVSVPAGNTTLKYRAGLQLMVSVKPNTLVFDFLGETREVPIIARKPASPSAAGDSTRDKH